MAGSNMCIYCTFYIHVTFLKRQILKYKLKATIYTIHINLVLSISMPMPNISCHIFPKTQ